MAAKQHSPLIKKHSQTDLVSRLKTRKILGVGGEDDDGEIHRSKISQVLGNEMKFAMREPLGLRIWQLVSAIMFSVVAVMFYLRIEARLKTNHLGMSVLFGDSFFQQKQGFHISDFIVHVYPSLHHQCTQSWQALTFPERLYEAVFDEDGSSTKMSVRLYGGALLSISLIMWNALYTAEKIIIRWTLLTEACYFTVQLLVTTIPLFERGALTQGATLLQFSRGFFILISVYYYYQVGRKPKKV